MRQICLIHYNREIARNISWLNHGLIYIMKDSVFRTYEQYVLHNRNLEEAQQKLVEGSESLVYLKAMDLLAKKGSKLSKEDKEVLEKAAATLPVHQQKKIALRELLLRYDSEEKLAEKQKILDQISSEFLSLSFNHPRPMNFVNSSKLDEGESMTQQRESLVSIVFNEKDQLERLYKGEQPISSYSPELLSKLDFSLLSADMLQQVIVAMGDKLCTINSKKFFQACAKHAKDRYLKTNSYGISQSVLQNMTIWQLDQMNQHLEFIKDDENFVVQYMKKKFITAFDTELDWKTIIERFMEMYKYTKKLSYKFSCINSLVLRKLLVIGMKLKEYDEAILLEYLKAPVDKIRILVNFAPSLSYNIRTSSIYSLLEKTEEEITDEALIKMYLVESCKKGRQMKVFKDLIEANFLANVWEETKFMLGEKVELTAENTERLENLAKKVSIDIMKHNKSTFAVGENVSLWVELKNAPTLLIKIFEINTENYYKKKLDAFHTDINLDGLVASFERSIDFKQPPHITLEKELTFPELKDKWGLYVIELIGNGKSSRAVIKLGTLSYISVSAPAGQECYLLDEKREICSSDATGIYLENAFFPADPKQKGKIIVPYVLGPPKRTKAVLIHQGQGQLIDFIREPEVYSLKCAFFMLPESFILGGKATVALRPLLLINGGEADLSLLQNVSCTLHTSNFTGDIPSSKTFAGLKPTANAELLVTFQVGPNIKNLSVELSADVYSKSKGTIETLNAAHAFEINSHFNDLATGELFLSMDKNGDYELLALGKNGEPLADSPVSASFICVGIKHCIDMKLRTNEEGMIKLGKLEKVKEVRATLTFQGAATSVSNIWILPDASAVTLPESMDFIEGEEAVLTIPYNKHRDIYFKKIVDKIAIEDCESLIHITRKDDFYVDIRFRELRQGEYTLWGTELNKIVIKVHKGIYWKEDNEYIQKPLSLLKAKKMQSAARVKRIKLESTSKMPYLNIEVDANKTEDWRAHVLLFRYLPQGLNAIISRFLPKTERPQAEFAFQHWKNFFLSNRELSTEFKYCLDRQSLPRFTGNTLPKPQLLLKREFLQETESVREVVNEGTNYLLAKEEVKATQNCDALMRMLGSTTYTEAKPLSRYHFAEQIATFHNFLAKEPITLFNLPANKDGLIKVELDEETLRNYSIALAVVVSKESVSHSLLPLGCPVTNKRDLSMQNPLDKAKAYCEMQTSKCVYKHDSYTIDDIASTDIQTVDSLEKLFVVLKQVAKLQKITIPDLEVFEKVLHWNILTDEDKDKFISANFCHELNLFLFKKDPAYFTKVIQPYLNNKMEKKLIDFYLLDEVENVGEFAQSSAKLASLNSLEKVLSVEILSRHGKKELANIVLKNLQNSLCGVKKPIHEQSRIFDTILSLNVLSEQKEGINLQSMIRIDMDKILEDAKCIEMSRKFDIHKFKKMKRKTSEMNSRNRKRSESCYSSSYSFYVRTQQRRMLQRFG
eukprot:TRINITY_DN3242_c0_g1_i1.p1 TRINITY_DN3242_c0_g1~~TRINITY_DN3242_c0_g1_i1.p1  ORF type:complete len:1469 (-),score=192.25 TRINITY_DN3242_c0_g1_i1:4794-9200(-)